MTGLAKPEHNLPASEFQEGVLARIESIYPDHQNEKSTGSVLRRCAAKVIAFDSIPFERFQNLFLFVPMILWGVMVCAYVYSLASIRSITGPVYLLALLCLFVFSLAAIILLVLWTSFWNSSGPSGSLVFYLSALAGLIPRALMLAGDFREPQGLFLRAATDAIFVCSFSSIVAVLALKIYDLGMDAIKARARWEKPVPYLLWSLFRALEGVTKPTDWLWLDPSIPNQPVDELENAARCLEIFQQRFADSRLASIPDVGRYYLRRAAGLRKLKMRACLPTPRNLEYLQQEIRRVLDFAAAGNWDQLPTTDLPAITPLSRRARALNLIRFLAVASLPALVVSALDAFQGLPPQFSAYIVTGAWVWAILSLLAALDPRFGEKLSAFKDLPNFSALGSKSKEGKDSKL
jgi:hypothetical protein